MSNEVKHLNQDTGVTLNVSVLNAAGQQWNGSQFVTRVVADWANYIAALAETPASGYLFVGPANTFISAIPAEQWLHVFIHRQAGAAAAISDPVIADGWLWWDGTSLVVDALHGMTEVV